MLCATDQHFDLVDEPCFQHRFQAHHARRAVGTQHIHVKRHADFEFRHAEQAFHQDVRIDRTAARFDDQPDVGVALVTDIGEDRQLLVIDQCRQRLDQLALLYTVGNFGDDCDPSAAPLILDAPPCADAETATPRRIGLRDQRRWIDDQSAGRKVWTFDELQQLAVLGIRRINQMSGSVDDFGHIMRRDARRHANRNATRAVRQQVWKQARENFRLFFLAIVRRFEIDRAVVEARHQVDGRLRQARLGIAIGSGVITINVAEIALPVDQRIAQCEILSEADHCVVH